MAVNDGDACLLPCDDEIVDELTDSITILSTTNILPLQICNAQSAALPCLDCGGVVVHASHCWIDGVWPAYHLTYIIDLRGQKPRAFSNLPRSSLSRSIASWSKT
jgi:hypothetical protein